MIRIPVNRAFTDSIPLPTASEGDTLAYMIYKQSDGSTFASGTMTYNVGIHWDVTFTPTTLNEKYLLEVVDAAGDRIASREYEAVGRTVEAPSGETLDTTPAGMLAAVNTAIAANLAGGAVQSYTIAGRDIERMPLMELYELKLKLERSIAATSGTGRNLIKFVRPS